MGINVTKAKISAFVISSFFAGIAGGLFAHYQGFIDPGKFDFNESVKAVIMVVIGGMGSILGSIVTGIGLGLIEGLTRVFYPEASAVVVFVIMVIVLLVRPAGLFGKA